MPLSKKERHQRGHRKVVHLPGVPCGYVNLYSVRVATKPSEVDCMRCKKRLLRASKEQHQIFKTQFEKIRNDIRIKNTDLTSLSNYKSRLPDFNLDF